YATAVFASSRIADQQTCHRRASVGFGQYVPLFRIPSIGRPPATARLPRAISRSNLIASLVIAKGHWLRIAQFHAHRYCRPHAPEGKTRPFSVLRSGCFKDREALHAKCAGTVRVFENR